MDRRLDLGLQGLRRNLIKIKNQDRIKHNILKALLRTTFGQLVEAFTKWKQFSNKKLLNSKVVVNDIEKKLLRIIFRRVKWGFENLKDNLSQYQEVRLQSIKKLIFATESKSKRLFEKWVNFTKFARYLEIHKSTNTIFSMISKNINSQVFDIITTGEDLLKKKSNLILLLKERIRSKLLFAFLYWKSQATKNKLENDLLNTKLEYPIQSYSQLFENLQKKSLRDAFNALKKTFRDNILKKKMINGLLKTKFGQLLDAFNKWKSIPTKAEIRKRSLVSKLEGKLWSIYLRRLKSGFDPLKDIRDEINNIKRKAIRQLFLITESNSKRLFHKWAATTRNLKQIEACKNTVTVFSIIDEAFVNEIRQLLAPERIALKRKQALT